MFLFMTLTYLFNLLSRIWFKSVHNGRFIPFKNPTSDFDSTSFLSRLLKKGVTGISSSNSSLYCEYKLSIEYDSKMVYLIFELVVDPFGPLQSHFELFSVSGQVGCVQKEPMK
jgi:hypothetical protein